MKTTVMRLAPGAALLVAVGLTARLLSTLVPLNHLILAIVLGILLANLVDLPERFEAGVGCYKLLLEAGIVIMGVRVALGQLFDVGLEVLALVVGFLVITLLTVELLARYVFVLEDKMGSLMAAGASVCGVSAVIAVAGGIKAREEHIAYVVGTILLFDAITIFAYPAVGTFLGLPDQVFGIWAGVSMFSTGPVTAAGFAYSDTAGQWATLTKLTRNLFIGTVAVLYSMYYVRDDSTTTGTSGVDRISDVVARIWSQFPKFVLGFVLMMIIASLGLLSSSQTVSLSHAYQWLFTFAFVGLGLNIQLESMRKTGRQPVLVLIVSLLVMSTASLLVVYSLFG